MCISFKRLPSFIIIIAATIIVGIRVITIVIKIENASMTTVSHITPVTGVLQTGTLTIDAINFASGTHLLLLGSFSLPNVIGHSATKSINIIRPIFHYASNGCPLSKINFLKFNPSSKRVLL